MDEREVSAQVLRGLIAQQAALTDRLRRTIRRNDMVRYLMYIATSVNLGAAAWNIWMSSTG